MTAKELAAELNKMLGAGTIRMGSDPSLIVTYIPTGVMPMDILLRGGLPRGRSVEIYGGYSTLKSYIGLSAIAQCQAAGGVAALVDTEHAYDPVWAASIGVDVDALLYIRVEMAEEAADAVELMLRRNVDLIVWDSVAATLPKAEARDDKNNIKSMTSKTQMARQAAFMSQALRKLNAANQNTAMLWINQTRSKIGIVFGDPTSIPGGKALPFYASYRIAMNHAGNSKIEEKTSVDGVVKSIKTTTANTIKASLLKSKLNRPFRDVFFNFDLQTGEVDDLGFIINQAVDLKLVKISTTGKTKTWSYGSVKGLGPKKFRTALEKSPANAARLTEKVLLSHSDAPLDKSKDESTSKPSSKRRVAVSTPTPAPVKSRTTAPSPAKSKTSRTRSSSPTRRTRSIAKNS